MYTAYNRMFEIGNILYEIDLMTYDYSIIP